MGELRDLVINLLATSIGLAAGLLRAGVVYRVRYWRDRRFWRRFSAPHTSIVLASKMAAWRHSGWLGMGDVSAVIDMQRRYDTIRVAFPRVHFGEHIAGSVRDNSLIAIGSDLDDIANELLD